MPPDNAAYVQDWFRIAELDLARVDRCLAAHDIDLAAFCLQQAAEKFLKGYLLTRGWNLRRIHDLEALLDDAVRSGPVLEQFRSVCRKVTKYYMLQRGPLPGATGPSEAELREQFVQILKLIEIIRASPASVAEAPSGSEVIWQPSSEQIERTQMHAFMRAMAGKYGFGPTWSELHRWSVENREQFWGEMFELAGIEVLDGGGGKDSPHGEAREGILAPAARAEFTDGRAAGGTVAGFVSSPTSDDVGHPVRGSTTTGEGMLGTKWFPGVQLNYAAHLLRHDGDRIAIQAENELGRTSSLTFRELREAVAACAAGLQAAGVVRGDRVAGFVPNVPESVIAMLATVSLGAVWSSCSPDFGINGVVDRFGQITPKVLFAADGYTYNGKPLDCLERVGHILERIPSIERVVVIGFVKDEPDLSPLPKAEHWRNFLKEPPPLLRKDGAQAETVGSGYRTHPTEPVPFDHPLFIMYSSGTTGVPKCIVHGHGGTLLQHMKELMLHCNLRPTDTIFYFTTCGWMMWNWVVSALGVGATLVLYEGSPAYARMSHLWQMAERLGITVFGTSPKYLSSCQKADLHPGREHDLSKLRCVLSTGSPLTVENFHWVYDNVKQDLQLSSISGGTDIISCFMLGNPILPVRAGEIQCLGLGMDVQAWDESGQAVTGQKAELVCKSAFPSQPIGFWNDADGSKYRDAYFSHYPGVWRHGDFIEITSNGGVIVYGRSDATLNPGGVRIGTAEIYRIVESIDEVADSLVVGREVDEDVEVWLFVVLGPGLRLDEALKSRIRQQIADSATKRHVPKHVRQVTAVPYTISGKKVELAVANLISGKPVKNRDALANPEVLDQYVGLV